MATLDQYDPFSGFKQNLANYQNLLFNMAALRGQQATQDRLLQQADMRNVAQLNKERESKELQASVASVPTPDQRQQGRTLADVKQTGYSGLPEYLKAPGGEEVPPNAEAGPPTRSENEMVKMSNMYQQERDKLDYKEEVAQKFIEKGKPEGATLMGQVLTHRGGLLKMGLDMVKEDPQAGATFLDKMYGIKIDPLNVQLNKTTEGKLLRTLEMGLYLAKTGDPGNIRRAQPIIEGVREALVKLNAPKADTTSEAPKIKEFKAWKKLTSGEQEEYMKHQKDLAVKPDKPDKADKPTMGDVKTGLGMKLSSIKARIAVDLTPEEQKGMSGLTDDKITTETLLETLLSSKSKTLSADKKQKYMEEISQAEKEFGELGDQVLGRKGVKKKVQPPPGAAKVEAPAPKYKTAVEVKADYAAKKITEEEAVAILRKDFGMQ